MERLSAEEHQRGKVGLEKEPLRFYLRQAEVCYLNFSFVEKNVAGLEIVVDDSFSAIEAVSTTINKNK